MVGAPQFAVGDCAVLRSWPEIPKAGVYAVREGAVLVDNLRAAVSGARLRAYTPQRDFLALLNLGDGIGLGARNGLPFSGRWVARLKDRIDRRFMERFVVLDAEGAEDTPFMREMPPMDESEMVCGGCAAKRRRSAVPGAGARGARRSGGHPWPRRAGRRGGAASPW